MLTCSYTPIVVSTVDEKNTACRILHFSSRGGKLFSTSKAKPLEDASSRTFKHEYYTLQNQKHKSFAKK